MAALGEGDAGTMLQLGETLLKNFIYERLACNNATVTRSQLGGTELCDPKLREVGQCLKKYGDELDQDVKLQSLINQLKPTKEVFVAVAREIFADGIFNWGRVVTLFYFACELVKQALRIPDLIQTIISWTVDFMVGPVINWIKEQGGWDAICSQIPVPSWKTAGVFLAGVLTTAIFMRNM
ncbi:apoptosis regulator BAX-like [Hoplias malabaricus]|uniref:apoptosis regulator BAX-like n=1 Tax=Hoplias malabaricus TaxID=27720 RepID=UPI0034634653